MSIPQIPGYQMLRPIGRGGMGVVWEAFEPRLDRNVAIKIEHPGAVSRRREEMFVEARAAARIGHPGVVPVHDVGFTVDGRPYYAMELVEGTDLEAVLRDGPMLPERALSLAAQIARAVAAAHERGIVHRDLKPGNVRIDRDGNARVLDFGMAMELTRDEPVDVVGGTLAYMSPEHLQGEPPAVGNDVWAIGVMLYEMLAGAVPFEARSVRSMVHDMENREAPLLSKLEPAIASRISPDVEQAVMRCLARDPALRYESARALADVLEGLARGRSLLELEPKEIEAVLAPSERAIAIDPRPSREGAQHFRWSVRLRSSPDQIWQAVADTDRFNRAVGLTPVTYEGASSDGRGVRIARTKLLGLETAWEEHPFEWVRDREHTVYRKYQRGPLDALWNRVSIEATDDGGSQVTHEIWARPRHLLGSLAARLELSMKFGPKAMKAYRAFDEAMQNARPTEVADPALPPHRASSEARDRVRVLGDRMRISHDPELVERLMVFVLTAPDRDVERIRPFALADRFQVARDAMLNVLLAGVRVGLLELAWDLVCPACGIAHDRASTLKRVTRSGLCSACGTAYDRDLASSVEVAMRPHREVRETEAQTYCIGAPAMRPHVMAQMLLHPGERRTVEVTLDRGRHRIVAPASGTLRTLEISATDTAQREALEVRVEDGEVAATSAVSRAGKVAITIVNASAQATMVRVEHLVSRDDALTAADALLVPALRGLIGVELLPLGEHVAVSRTAMVCVGLLDPAQIFEGATDAEVLERRLELDRTLQAIAGSHRGAIVESSFDRTTIAFPSAERAVAGALALVTALLEGPFGAHARLSLHAGPCLALTRDDRMHYFGETVARASALLAESGPGNVALSGCVADDPGVAGLLQAKKAKVRVAHSKEAKPRRVLLVTPAFELRAMLEE